MNGILWELSAFPMNETTKVGLGSLLNGASYLLFVIAFMAFWFGGGLIHAVTQTDRVLAEGEGIGLAMLFGGIGALVKTIATRLETGDGMISLSDSLRIQMACALGECVYRDYPELADQAH